MRVTLQGAAVSAVEFALIEHRLETALLAFTLSAIGYGSNLFVRGNQVSELELTEGIGEVLGLSFAL